jgi:hypothetical protein
VILLLFQITVTILWPHMLYTEGPKWIVSAIYEPTPSQPLHLQLNLLFFSLHCRRSTPAIDPPSFLVTPQTLPNGSRKNPVFMFRLKTTHLRMGGSKHGCMARGGHGLPKLSLGLAMPSRRPPLKWSSGSRLLPPWTPRAACLWFQYRGMFSYMGT